MAVAIVPITVYCMIYRGNMFGLIDDSKVVDKVLLMPEGAVILDELFHCLFIYILNKTITRSSSLKLNGFLISKLCINQSINQSAISQFLFA